MKKARTWYLNKNLGMPPNREQRIGVNTSLKEVVIQLVEKCKPNNNI